MTHTFPDRSMGLLTDLYQLTMAYGYWKHGLAEREAVFHLFFRRNPFKGGYGVACGLARAMELMTGWGFDDADLAYLAGIQGNDGAPLFEPAFLEYLGGLRFSCDVDAMPEGTVAFPHEPLLRVRGPLLQAQIIETPLLNIVNFETLIATKASRVCAAAQGEPVLEFGLRRAQGVDGGLTASRAAYVGGCAATSNVLAGRLFDIPVKGTHAHSWVMVFDDEVEAFERYAEVMPNNCVFLVDTYDTLEGVRRAVEVGTRLRARGYEMVGVRLDSGDLAELSIGARAILDAGGFPDAAIVASNDLHEGSIADLKQRGATIGVWGVGTKLATAYDQPALGGVYKLAAIRDEAGEWVFKIKLSNTPIKVSIPGVLQVMRYTGDDGLLGDVIVNEAAPRAADHAGVSMNDGSPHPSFPTDARAEPVLVPVMRDGRIVYEAPDIHTSRARCHAQLAALGTGVRRHRSPDAYQVGLDGDLYALKMALIARAGGEGG